MIQRGHKRWWFRLAAFTAVAVIAALALLVYSPWHRHDPLAAGVCPFCHFQHVPSEAASGELVCPAPSMPALWLAHSGLAIAVSWTALPSWFTRGPPASSSSALAA